MSIVKTPSYCKNQILNKTSLIFCGHFTQFQVVLVVSIEVLVFATLVLISYVLWEQNYYQIQFDQPQAHDYNIMRDSVSALGSWKVTDNPLGWAYFTTGMILLGIFYIPLVSYAKRRLELIHKKWVLLNAVLWYIGTVGISVLALGYFFQGYLSSIKNLMSVHVIIAWVAVGCFALGIVECIVLLIYDQNKCKCCKKQQKNTDIKLVETKKVLQQKDDFDSQKPLPENANLLQADSGEVRASKQFPVFKKRVLIPFCCEIVIMFFCFIFLVGWEFVYPAWKQSNPNLGHWPGVGIFSFPLWEWIVVCSVILGYFLFILLLPNDLQALIIERK